MCSLVLSRVFFFQLGNSSTFSSGKRVRDDESTHSNRAEEKRQEKKNT